MGYERTLLTRWTRRDWLAIAMIALTTTFLVGTSIMILAAGSQIGGEVQRLDALETAEFADEPVVAPGAEAVNLPVAEATTANGTSVTVVGLPEATVNLTSSFDDATLGNPPPSGVVERGTTNRSTVRLAGSAGNVTLEVHDPSNRSVLPDRWYSARQATVRELGRTGEFRLDIDAAGNATNASGIPDGGTLLLGTPGFLTTGGSEIVELLGVVTLASGLLIGVTVYSVTRMTVRDRRRTLFVVRSTGGTRRRLVGLFGVRAALLTVVGAAFGYAIGIILINAVINVATYYGTLTTIDVSGSPTDRLVLGAMLATIVAIGLVAGALSVIRTAAAPPASLMGAGSGVATMEGFAARIREAVGVEVIGVRTVVPMTAALTVLIAIAVVSVSLGLTLAPIAGATDGVVMSPDAGYPLQSQVDENLVTSFRAAGIPASPEVLLPQVRDGQPYVMRGVNYSAYRQVSDVSVTAGRKPAAIDEALLGGGLARTLGVEVGDTITVGGGTAFGIDRVTIVGRFEGEGYLDDQLLISLAVGKQLANMEDGSVQIIRTTGAERPPNAGNETTTPTPTPTPTAADIVVTGVSVPETGTVNRSVPVEVTLENRGDVAGTRTLSLPVNGTTNETPVTVEGRQVRTVTLTASFRAPGDYALTVGGVNATVTVDPAPADIVVTDVAVPDTGVVNRNVSIDVTLANRGDRDGNLTLTVPVNGTDRDTTVAVAGNQERTVTLSARFDATGTYTLTTGGIETQVQVVEPSPADIVITDVSVPETGIVNRSVPVEVTLENRGDLAGTRTLTTPVNGSEQATTVTVQGRETRTVTLAAAFRSLGRYTITVGGIDSEVEIVEPAPADVVVTDVMVPELAFVDANVPVEVTLENRGDLAGTRTLTTPVNGSEQATTVTVQGRETRTVTLAAAFRTPDTYTVTVSGIDAQVEIIEPSPADIVVTNVSAPTRGFVNERLPIAVTLENRGDRAGNVTLTTPVNGTDRDITETVEGKTTRNVTLNAIYQTEGTYTLTVGDVDTEIRILDQRPADVVVTNVSVPAVWRVDSGVPIEVTLENRGDITGNGTLSVPVNGTDRETTVPVDGSEKRTVTRTAWFRAAGDYTVTVAGEGTRIRIVEPGNVSLSPLPGRAPPNATLVVTARDRAGAVVPGLRFRLGGEQFRTGADGRVRIRVPSDPGQHRLESRIGERILHNRSLEVTADVERSFLVTLQMRPEQVVFPNTTEGTVTAHNPWGSSLSRELLLQREREPVIRRTVELAPGDATTITTSVDPATTSATQRVRVLSDGRVLAEATFTVEASDRIVAVLGRAGLYEPGSGLLRSLDSLLGNFQVLQVSLIVLALLMGIGSTATVVIQATHARRRTIGIQRVTGAAPRDVVGTILGDGLRVGAIASVIGIVGAYLGLTVLVRLGYAVIFGVRIPPLLNPWLVLGVLGGALVVVAASSVIAAAWVLRVSPGALVTASTQRVPDQDDGQPAAGPEVEG